MERDEPFLLDDLLSGGAEDPVDVGLNFAGRFASGVEVELAGDGILAAAGHLDAGFDGRAALLGGDLQPIHVGRLITHAAVAEAGGGPGYVLDHLRRAVQFADAAAELALLLVRGLAADVLTEIIVGSRAILPAEEGDLAFEGGVDFLPPRGGAAFGPD